MGLARSLAFCIAALAATSACGGAAVRTAPLDGGGETARATPPGADEILRRAERIRNPERARAAEVEILSVLPDASAPGRQSSYSLASHGAADTLALRQSEDEMRGAVLLFSEERTWLLRPAAGIREPYELAGALARIGDWVVLRIVHLDLRSGWQIGPLREERYAGEACFKLELTRSSAPLPWNRILYWIGKADFLPKRLEGYADNGTLVSMIRYEGFTESPLGTYVRRLVVEGSNPSDEMHTATFSDVRPLAGDPSRFTTQGMLALREAAREQGVMRKNAARVRIEELLFPGSER